MTDQLIFGLDSKRWQLAASQCLYQALTHQELKKRFCIRQFPVPNTTKEILEVFTKNPNLLARSRVGWFKNLGWVICGTQSRLCACTVWTKNPDAFLCNVHACILSQETIRMQNGLPRKTPDAGNGSCFVIWTSSLLAHTSFPLLGGWLLINQARGGVKPEPNTTDMHPTLLETFWRISLFQRTQMQSSMWRKV